MLSMLRSATVYAYYMLLLLSGLVTVLQQRHAAFPVDTAQTNRADAPFGCTASAFKYGHKPSVEAEILAPQPQQQLVVLAGL